MKKGKLIKLPKNIKGSKLIRIMEFEKHYVICTDKQNIVINKPNPQ